MSVPLQIRTKVAADHANVVALMRSTHEANAYPIFWPPDPDAFANAPAELGAWVVEADAELVGHVALHHAAEDPVAPLARAATGRPDSGLVVVARLLVAPDQQGNGVGQRLLEHAEREAHTRGLHPVLDVNATSLDAVAFYERQSAWTRVGDLTLDIGDYGEIALVAYVGPPPSDSPGEP